MIKVTLVSPADCPNCAEIREQLNSLKKTHSGLVVDYIDAHSSEGERLILKHGILASPGILINDQFLAMGAVSEQKIIQAITRAAKVA